MEPDQHASLNLKPELGSSGTPPSGLQLTLTWWMLVPLMLPLRSTRNTSSLVALCSSRGSRSKSGQKLSIRTGLLRMSLWYRFLTNSSCGPRQQRASNLLLHENTGKGDGLSRQEEEDVSVHLNSLIFHSQGNLCKSDLAFVALIKMFIGFHFFRFSVYIYIYIYACQVSIMYVHISYWTYVTKLSPLLRLLATNRDSLRVRGLVNHYLCRSALTLHRAYHMHATANLHAKSTGDY
ncbi:hypothetical protein EYF80_021952 [Liparis tanakae]|uniref:Uncharacterized protein n=1 Tax=Liparis tanakae TaxID=230148 RepID=A0A4Z2HPQ5_9TELE|nr:hypothetical protein EYF80_021952 [Liparis tanakae]